MIVDDEDFVTLLAQARSGGEGYRVVTAKDGFQAIEIYRKLRDQIALIILDFTHAAHGRLGRFHRTA